MSTAHVRKKLMADFTSAISELLSITGWSQAELARQLDAPGAGDGIDRATITNWLKKKTAPDGTARYAIADLLRRARAGEFKKELTAAAG